jgi:hypothetical protein
VFEQSVALEIHESLGAIQMLSGRWRGAKVRDFLATRKKLLVELLDPAVVIVLVVVGLLIAMDAVALAYGR